MSKLREEPSTFDDNLYRALSKRFVEIYFTSYAETSASMLLDIMTHMPRIEDQTEANHTRPRSPSPHPVLDVPLVVVLQIEPGR